MSRRALTVGAAAVTAGAVVLFGLPVLLVMFVMGNSTEQQTGCGTPGSVVLAGFNAEPFDETQLAHAGTVISVGRQLGLPERGILVALTVVSQESSFKNYANDGEGNDLAPDQAGIEASLELPHDAVGSDHGSLGIFQQQWPWWGTMPQLMDPATATRKFYERLQQIPGWTRMSIPAAGQAVQRSAFPDAYDDDVELAEQLLESAGTASQGDDPYAAAGYFGSQPVPAACLGSAVGGGVVQPLEDPQSFVDQASFGTSGALWETTHTGTDFSAACGTPVRAATGGAVTVRTDQAWAGRWLVQIDSGTVETWYAHMQAIQVEDGQQVRAGQRIGQVGSEGNATGCHLHFEVRPGGGLPVDPTTWLAEHVGQSHAATSIGSLTQTAGVDSAVMISANIPFWLRDSTVQRRIRTLLAHDPDVLLLQEMRVRDVPRMVAGIRGPWAAWQPDGERGRGAIVWNTNKFSVARKGIAFGVDVGPYESWMPWMLLQGATGTLPVVNIHMPTNSSTSAVMQAHFRAMTTRYQRLVRDFTLDGYPPVIGGDWNHPLDVAREWWSPVPMLKQVSMTTNWQHGRPCQGTSARNGRIDGFAYNPGYLQVARQGCLERGPSDHRPIWVELVPAG